MQAQAAPSTVPAQQPAPSTAPLPTTSTANTLSPASPLAGQPPSKPLATGGTDVTGVVQNQVPAKSPTGTPAVTRIAQKQAPAKPLTPAASTQLTPEAKAPEPTDSTSGGFLDRLRDGFRPLQYAVGGMLKWEGGLMDSLGDEANSLGDGLKGFVKKQEKELDAQGATAQPDLEGGMNGSGEWASQGFGAGLLHGAGGLLHTIGSVQRYAGNMVEGDPETWQKTGSTLKSIAQGTAYVEGSALQSGLGVIPGMGRLPGQSAVGQALQNLAPPDVQRSIDAFVHNAPGMVGQRIAHDASDPLDATDDFGQFAFNLAVAKGLGALGTAGDVAEAGGLLDQSAAGAARTTEQWLANPATRVVQSRSLKAGRVFAVKMDGEVPPGVSAGEEPHAIVKFGHEEELNREAAAYKVARAMNDEKTNPGGTFANVPVTVIRNVQGEGLPQGGGVGAVMQFVKGHSAYAKQDLWSALRADTSSGAGNRLATLKTVLGDSDDHWFNVYFDPKDNPVPIDHEAAFPTKNDPTRTAGHYTFTRNPAPLTQESRDALQRLVDNRESVNQELSQLLEPEAISAMWERVDRSLSDGRIWTGWHGRGL